MSLSLERKVSLSVLLVIIIAISAIFIVFSISRKSTILESERKYLTLKADHQLTFLEQELSRIQQDINFLADSPNLLSIINSKPDRKIKLEGRTELQKLQEEISRLIKNRDSYKQIEILSIENGGRELLKINRENGTVHTVQQSQLNTTGENRYLKGILKQEPEPGQFYISGIEYNKDREEVAELKKAIIRLSRPLYSKVGEVFGLIRLNIDFTYPLEHLVGYQEEGEHIVIRLPDGNYVYLMQGKVIMVKARNNNSELIKDNKDDYLNKLNILLNELMHQNSNLVDSEMILVHKILELGSGRYFMLIIGKDLSKTAIKRINVISENNYIIIPITLVLVLISIYIIRLPLSKLNELGNIIKGIASEERNRSDLPVYLKNEVGDLSRAFNALLDKVENSEKKIEKSKEQLELAIKGTSDGIWDWNLKTNVLFLSQRWKEMLGYRDDEIKNQLTTFYELIHSDDKKYVKKTVIAFLKGKLDKFEIEYKLLHKNGKYIDILSRAYAVRDTNNKPIRLVGTQTDITDRKKEMQQRIKHEREQKRALVREVHHRIKNNLQGVASLLRQQTNEHTKYKGELNSAISQVYTVAMVHGIQGKDEDGGIYLHKMVKEIISHTETLTGIKIKGKIENNYCNCKILEQESVPIALILNELLTNACKYSKDRRSVYVNMVCNWCDSHSVLLNIKNDIESFPVKFNLMEKTGIGTGLKLVTSLLPLDGVSLDIREESGFCQTVLVLQKPVIYVESQLEYVVFNQT